MAWEICTWDWIGAETLRNIFGYSWSIECVGSIRAPSNTISNIIHNDILKPFRVGILWYAERAHKMHDLANY